MRVTWRRVQFGTHCRNNLANMQMQGGGKYQTQEYDAGMSALLAASAHASHAMPCSADSAPASSDNADAAPASSAHDENDNCLNTAFSCSDTHRRTKRRRPWTSHRKAGVLPVPYALSIPVCKEGMVSTDRCTQECKYQGASQHRAGWW
jgi:hypothetical protein